MLIPYPYSLCSLYIPRPGRVLRPLKYCHVPKAEAAARLLGQLLDDTEPCRNQLDVRRWAAAILLIQMFLCCYVVPKMHIGWFPLIQDVWGCFRMLQDVSGCSWYLFFYSWNLQCYNKRSSNGGRAQGLFRMRWCDVRPHVVLASSCRCGVSWGVANW